ncbi:hypothetical protein ACH4PU_30680 [Streptomyces sp. NPDC021100]|uniref:hypothetical protein n=1 Tax=Streptomyces sp. NPDC021100 TaxID=3365114 RepID=UPI00379E0D87
MNNMVLVEDFAASAAELLHRAAEIATREHKDLLYGLSGRPLDSRKVARHLYATAQHLRADGTGVNLGDALQAVADEIGTSDTYRAAVMSMELLIRAATGAPTACYEAWAETATTDEAQGLLAVAVAFARRHIG